MRLLGWLNTRKQGNRRSAGKVNRFSKAVWGLLWVLAPPFFFPGSETRAASAPVIVGVLAQVRSGLFREVETRRLGWGQLSSVAPPGAVLLAVRDCSLLGRDVDLFVPSLPQRYQGRVVDCQQEGHVPLDALGLAADYEGPDEINHLWGAVIVR